MMHYKEVCEYGEAHGQCRCPDPAKSVKKVACDNPVHQRKYEGQRASGLDYVRWRCTGCKVEWWGPRETSSDFWYDEIQCVCSPGAEPLFELVDLKPAGSGQRTLL